MLLPACAGEGWASPGGLPAYWQGCLLSLLCDCSGNCSTPTDLMCAAALMENQVEGLKAKQIPADLLSSQRSEQDRREILADIQSSRPRLRLLFVTPELIATDRLVTHLLGMYSFRVLLDL